MWEQLWEVDVVGWEQRIRAEQARSGKRKDTMRSCASVYHFERVWHEDSVRVEVVD